MIFRPSILLAAVMTLGSCETIIEQLDRSKPFVVVKQNPSQGPVRKPNISVVILLENGNILEVSRLVETFDEIYPNAFVQDAGQSLHLSPNSKFIGVTQPDDTNTENNIGIYSVPNTNQEYSGSDNVLSGEMERVCNTPEILADIYNGPPNWGATISNYRISFEDDIANAISIVGWRANSDVVVRWVATIKVTADETTPDGTVTSLSAFEPADFYMTMRRSSSGTWLGQDCFGDTPGTVTVAQSTLVTPAPVSGVLVNGVPKDSAQPLGRVVEVQGPY